MPIVKTDVQALRDAERAYKDALSAIAAKMPDPSVCVITGPDGTQTAFVRIKGKSGEVADISYLDMRT